MSTLFVFSRSPRLYCLYSCRRVRPYTPSFGVTCVLLPPTTLFSLHAASLNGPHLPLTKLLPSPLRLRRFPALGVRAGGPPLSVLFSSLKRYEVRFALSGFAGAGVLHRAFAAPLPLRTFLLARPCDDPSLPRTLHPRVPSPESPPLLILDSSSRVAGLCSSTNFFSPSTRPPTNCLPPVVFHARPPPFALSTYFATRFF